MVLWLGTIVTGSGPHSGDLDSRRTGLDPQLMSHVHAWAVYVLLALTLVTMVVTRRAGHAATARAAGALLLVELLQGVIGFVQYLNDLPEVLVGLHMFGAALISIGLAWPGPRRPGHASAAERPTSGHGDGGSSAPPSHRMNRRHPVRRSRGRIGCSAGRTFSFGAGGGG